MKQDTSIDRDELERIATAVIEAIRAREPAALVALLHPDQRAEAGPDFAPGGGAHGGFFDDDAWRYQSSQSWSGSFSTIRIRRDDETTKARLVIGEYQGKSVSVELFRQGSAWYFKDLRKRDVSGWGEPLPGGNGEVDDSPPGSSS